MRNKLKKYLIKGLIFLSSRRYISFKADKNSQIVFVMGMFRSGTSLTMTVLKNLGMDIGKSYRLLQGKGALRDLNPNGFQEDFLFAQLSRIWFDELGKNGANPPDLDETNAFVLSKIKIADFIKKSEFEYNEDRISFKNRFFNYLILFIKKENAFASQRGRLIKIPMLVPFHKQLIDWMPNSKYILVIRNPNSTIKSSKKLTESANIELYNKYYEHLLELEKRKDCVIISYDDLIKLPKESIKKICNHFNLPLKEEVCNLIDNRLIRNSSINNISNNYYEALYKKAINKI